MKTEFQNLFDDAVALLHTLTTPKGILASNIEADNYKRIWARDSVVCGLAGLLIEDDLITEGLKNSLLSLARSQHPLGMIPSNVDPSNLDDVSFGSLAGRIDTNTWFIVGSCNYFLHTGDEPTWNTLRPAIEKCHLFLKSVEFNNKGWLYTPLSGNWADEYPIHGYTLYDNMLRLWGEQLWEKITGECMDDFEEIQHRTLHNFWPSTTTPREYIYHEKAFSRLDFDNINHFKAFILPGKYDGRFDAAGNALALLFFKLNEKQKVGLSRFLDSMASEMPSPLIPAFWPVITENSTDWDLLKGNYSYSFKNEAGAFHNGGIWPVWMGLFCLGLQANGMSVESETIISSFVETVQKSSQWNFQEYIHSKTLELGGKSEMGYSASGIVFMQAALQNRKNILF